MVQKQVILIIVLSIVIFGTVFFFLRTHKSSIKHENGIIIEKQFSAEFDGSGTGIGMTTKGNMVVTSDHIHKDEQFMVVFKCEHKTIFTIDSKELYYDFEKGDSVIINYYEILNRNNEVVKFDFVSASKLNN